MEITFEETRGRIHASLHLNSIGPDALITITGGDMPHIGVVYTGGKDGIFQRSVFEHHKEEIIVEKIAMELLAGQWFEHFVVIGGIHVQKISLAEIKEVISISDILRNRMKEYLIQNPPFSIMEKGAV